jgi:3D (Asp-Asp-Asp) domain-containing protein
LRRARTTVRAIVVVARHELPACTRSAALLLLALFAAMALSVHPRTGLPISLALGDRRLDAPTVGPRCPLSAYAPAGSDDDLWILPTQRLVLPMDLIAAGYPDRLPREHDVVVRVTCTAYSSTPDQTDSTPFQTASMQTVQRGFIALSRDLLRRYTDGAPFDFGDHVEVVGVGVFRVEDTMHRRWRRRADLWVRSRAEARLWGCRTVLIGAVHDTGGVRILDRSPVLGEQLFLECERLNAADEAPADDGDGSV